jgi:FecR protein
MNRFYLYALFCFCWCVFSSAGSLCAEKPAKPVGRIVKTGGKVSLKKRGNKKFAAGNVGTKLFAGDEVKTSRKSFAQLRLADNTSLTLGANSKLLLRAVRAAGKDGATKLDLDGGSLGLTIGKPLAARQRYEVSTPVAVCGVRGTRFVVQHDLGGRGPKWGVSTVYVGSGKVRVNCRNPKVAAAFRLLTAGQSQGVAWDGFVDAAPKKVGKQRLEELMKALPGWVPDPKGIGLKDGGNGGGQAGRKLPGELANLDSGKRGTGAVDQGSTPGSAFGKGNNGFHKATAGAIFGRLGIGSGTPMGRAVGSDDAADPTSGQDPVNNVPVRPGQPLFPDQRFQFVD